MLKVAQPLEVAVRRLFEDTVQRLEHALHAVCSDFNGDRYGKVRHLTLLIWHVMPPVCMALLWVRSCQRLWLGCHLCWAATCAVSRLLRAACR